MTDLPVLLITNKLESVVIAALFESKRRMIGPLIDGLLEHSVDRHDGEFLEIELCRAQLHRLVELRREVGRRRNEIVRSISPIDFRVIRRQRLYAI